MVMNPACIGTKNDYTGEGQQLLEVLKCIIAVSMKRERNSFSNYIFP
jgi:hypothetical protein